MPDSKIHPLVAEFDSVVRGLMSDVDEAHRLAAEHRCRVDTAYYMIQSNRALKREVDRKRAADNP